MGCVNAKFLKVLNGRWTEQIGSHSCHHEHLRTTKTSSDRLIRALTPESEMEFLAEDRFPRLRELIRERSEIDVGTSNYGNARAPGHLFRRRSWKTPSL